MKKLFVLIALISLVLSSCTRADNEEEPLKLVFKIDGELPEIEDFSSGSAGRFYEEYTPDFIPSDEYGLILPYIGSYRTFVTTDYPDWQAEQGYASYGFCTPDGKIVMDASDKTSIVNYFETSDGFGYYAVTRDLQQKDDAPDEFMASETLIIPKDGSWCITLEPGSWLQDADYGHFAIVSYPRQEENPVVESIIYDYDGNYVTTLVGVDSISFAPDGLLYTSKWENNKSYHSYMNFDGETVFGPYASLAHFNSKGITYVEDYNGEWYFVNKDGQRLTDKEYGAIHRSGGFDVGEDLYVARYPDNKRTLDIYNGDAEIIGTIYGTSGASFRFPDNGEIIYSFYSSDGKGTEIFKRLSDNSDFVSKEYGVMPNSYDGDYNTYIYKNDEKGVVFDADGETIIEIDDLDSFMNMSKDKRFITYTIGDYKFGFNEETGESEIDDTRRTVVYDMQKGEAVYCVDGGGYAHFVGDEDRYVYISIYRETSVIGGESLFYLYDTQEGKEVFSGCRALSILTIDGKDYFSVCTGKISTLYDGYMNPIIRNYNE